MTPKDIQKLRKRLGLTREQFAARLGTTLGSVNNWESGRHKPSRVWVEKIEALREEQ